MIISRTPHRISLCGGGCDYEDFYKDNKAAVLSFSINKYQYHILENSFDNKNYLTYLTTNEIVNDIDDINHIGIKTIFNFYNIKNVNYKVISDIYHNIGLGSSSCFYVGLYTLLNEYKGLNLSKKDIAELACKIEIECLKQPIGKQDQYATALGGINLLEFNNNGVCDTNLNYIDYKRLINNFILFKIERFNSNQILKNMKDNLDNNKDILKKMVDLVYILKDNLVNNNFDNVGLILNDNWFYKKQLNSNITNEQINNIYKKGLKNGATGGKIVGAGGGGGILFYTENKEKLRSVFNNLEEINFDIDLEGTKIIYKL